MYSKPTSEWLICVKDWGYVVPGLFMATAKVWNGEEWNFSLKTLFIIGSFRVNRTNFGC